MLDQRLHVIHLITVQADDDIARLKNTIRRSSPYKYSFFIIQTGRRTVAKPLHIIYLSTEEIDKRVFSIGSLCK